MTTDPTAPNPETVEALAKALREVDDPRRVGVTDWTRITEDARQFWRERVESTLSHPAMRALLADTARAAEGKVIERVEAVRDHCDSRADDLMDQQPDRYEQGLIDAYGAAVIRLDTALRASEADRG